MRIQSCRQIGAVFLVLGLAGCSGESPSSGTSLAPAAEEPGTAASAPPKGESNDAAEPSDGDGLVADADDADDSAGDDVAPDGAEDEGSIGDSAGVPGPAATATATSAPGAAPTAVLPGGTPPPPIGTTTPADEPDISAPADPDTDEPSFEGSGGSSDAADDDSTSADDETDPGEAEAPSEDAGAELADPVEPEPEPEPPPPPANQAGLLTAGVWDDNRNFDRFEAFREGIYQSGAAGLLDFEASEYEAANELFSQTAGPKDTLDIALVIDTTGSMGDEIEYLQTEIRSISMRIEKVYPDAEQRWALIVYRDVGDEYVTQTFDFDTDLDTFRDNLAEQSVGGGGDFPEAPEAAFEAMNQLSWRGDEATAKIAFWVADAPYHQKDAEDMTAAIVGTQELGVHVYPVASSGIDEFTELAMRSTAQLTGGRYVFLTDDSGVGGAHIEPSIPCYFVTRLDVAMLRMVNIEMSGEYQVPADDEIIRSGGDPQDGACELSSGDAVFVF